MFYRILKTYAKENVAGTRTIYEDLKQQYPSAKKKAPENKETL